MRTLAVIPLLLALASCTDMHEYVQGDLRQPADLPELSPELRVKLAWSVQLEAFDTLQDFKLRPLAHDGLVYVAESRGRLAVHKSRNGDLVWDRLYDTTFSAGPVANADMLILGTDTAELWAVRADNGDVLWRASISSELLSPPLVAGDVIVAHTSDDKLIGVNAKTGLRIWVSSFSLPSLTLRGTAEPVVWNDAVICGLANGKITAVNSANGKKLWETVLGVARGRTEIDRLVDLDGAAAIVDDILYINGYQGKTAALDLHNGQILWARDMSSYGDMLVQGNMLIVVDEFSQLWALDRATGATMWRQDGLHGRGLTSPAQQGSYLVVGDYAGYLHWLTLAEGRIIGRARLKQAEVRARVLGEVAYPEEDPLHRYVDITGVPVKPYIDNDRLYVTDRSGVLAAYNISAVN